MIALSFLGTGAYETTTYVLGERQCRTNFFPLAMRAFFAPERLLVIVTAEAEAKHGAALQAVGPCELVRIPPGRTEEELWQIFSILADAVPAGTELLLDVTHGFRSQPMLALTAALYLQAARDVQTRGVYYGAWEARDRATDETPVFDLTPLLDLAAWSAATRHYLRGGDAAPLGELLAAIHRRTYVQQDAPYQARSLATVGNCLDRLTTALGVVRPAEVAADAASLDRALHRLQEDLDHLPQTRPLSLLVRRIEAQTAPLAQAGLDLFSPAGFTAQAAMLDFYLATKQYAQAYTLAREVLVSRVAADLTGTLEAASTAGRTWKEHPVIEKENRRRAQDQLQTWTTAWIGSEPLEKEARELAELWHQITELRNDVNHAGMRTNPKPAAVIVKHAEVLCAQVKAVITRPGRVCPPGTP